MELPQEESDGSNASTDERGDTDDGQPETEFPGSPRQIFALLQHLNEHGDWRHSQCDQLEKFESDG